MLWELKEEEKSSNPRTAAVGSLNLLPVDSQFIDSAPEILFFLLLAFRNERTTELWLWHNKRSVVVPLNHYTRRNEVSGLVLTMKEFKMSYSRNKTPGD